MMQDKEMPASPIQGRGVGVARAGVRTGVVRNKKLPRSKCR